MPHNNRFEKMTPRQIFRKVTPANSADMKGEPKSMLSQLSFGQLSFGNWRQKAVIGVLVLLICPFFYYGILPLFLQKIDDNLDLSLPVEPTKSQAVAVTAELVRREVEEYGWVANDPFFFPTYALDNMPNYQLGMIAALSRFTLEMSDQIGRMRGSSQIDPDLDNAVGKLKYSGKTWVLDFKTSFMPVAPSEDQYRAAWKALNSYNRRVAMGDAIFERRADNLQVTLDRIALHLGSVSAMLDDRIQQSGFLPYDAQADDVFYQVKGVLYAYTMIVKALQQDFNRLITERELVKVWENLVLSLEAAARLSPVIVTNGGADSLLFPNHLAIQGFYLLRARTQLRELTSILQK